MRPRGPPHAIFACRDFWRILIARRFASVDRYALYPITIRTLDWLTHILFWHWWVAAALLVALEILRPAYIFLWLGFAAAAMGFLLLVFPNIPVRAQLILFGLLCLIALVAWRRYRRDDSRIASRRG